MEAEEAKEAAEAMERGRVCAVVKVREEVREESVHRKAAARVVRSQRRGHDHRSLGSWRSDATAIESRAGEPQGRKLGRQRGQADAVVSEG